MVDYTKLLKLYESLPEYRSKAIPRVLRDQSQNTTGPEKVEEEEEVVTSGEPKVKGEEEEVITQPTFVSVKKANEIKNKRRKSAANVEYVINPDGTIKVGNRTFKSGDFYDDSRYRYKGKPLKVKAEDLSDPAYLNALLDAQIYRESMGIPSIIGSTNDRGLAQFSDPTWETAVKNKWVKEGASPFDPGAALQAQKNYINWIYTRPWISSAKTNEERIRRTLAGYNAGPYAVRNAVLRAGDNWMSLLSPGVKQYANDIMSDFRQRISQGAYTPLYIRQ